MWVIDAAHENGVAWGPALAGQEAGARKLLKGFDRQVQARIGSLPWPLRVAVPPLLRPATAVLHRVLGDHFGSEVDELAETVGVAAGDIILANLAYDLTNAAGCSTFVTACARGPLHARTLDWEYPGNLLRTHLLTTRVRGAPAGDYAMVGWPGFFGALTGMAPDRFSVTVNFVQHASESGVRGALKRAAAGAWPVPWAVRMALDGCKTFRSAVRFLSDVELLSPVLFTVAGTRAGEAVTIERSPRHHVQRRRRDGRALTTNHYVADEYEGDNVDLDETSTVERYDQLERTLARGASLSPEEALRALSKGWVNDANTQHRAVMSAAEGLLKVQVPGRRSVTVDL